VSRRGWWPLALAVAVTAFDPFAPALLAKGGLVLLVALLGAGLTVASWRLTPVLLATSALPLSLGASLLSAKHPEPTALAPWLVVPLVLAASSPRAPEMRKGDSRTYATAVLIASALVAAVEWLRDLPIDGGHGNPNALGLVAAACLPLALRGSTARKACVLLLGGALLLVSASRTAWVAVAIAVLVFGRGKWRLLCVPLLGALTYAAVRGDLAAASGGRLYLANVGVRAGLDAAPFGVGLGGYPFAFLQAQAQVLARVPPKEASRLFAHAVTPHGDWLGLFAVGGVIAVVACLAAVRASVRAVKGHSASAACLLIVGVAGFGDDALVLPGVAVAVALALAAVDAVDTGIAPRAELAMLPALVGLTTFATMPGMVRRYGAQRCVHLAGRATTDTEAHRRLLARARRIDPTDGEAALASGLAFLAEGNAAAALEELRLSEARLANVGTAIARGNAELTLGRPAAAVAAYREASRLDPGSFRAHANLVEALTQLGAFEMAEAELALARTLQPHHPKLERMADALHRARMDAAAAGELGPE